MRAEPMSQVRTPVCSGGFCLTELMVALGIGMVVTTMAFHVVSDLEGRFRNQHRNMALAQDARLGLAVFEQDVRCAAADPLAGGAVLRRAEPSTVEFLANVNGHETTLTSAAMAGQQELAVEDATDWAEGKQVRLCSPIRCFENRVAKGGQRSRLLLVWPIPESIPAGTEVTVLNIVRYYVAAGARNTYKVMRQVDGGANPLIGDLHAATFRYWTRTGAPTNDLRQAAMVRLEVAVGTERRSIGQDVALRL